ncbi:AAA family ATPase [Saccharibacillus sp. JS10]|uniref:AAA family ATPase n=1 Tax=Saccharibacillus sp. JS10 TaxID=2950552 RepID=UPI00210C88D8|nr:AAA family ATPase [Saccharibacillus sp. JS10]MCQ4088280.1 AAA family ATPase [Saccharibacillus sp. JS10]
MNTIHMLVGIPGSGKSVYARQLEKSTRGVIVSTDGIRQRLFGGESKQKNTYVIFDQAFRDISEALADGRDVIFDATNIDRSRRAKFLKRFSEYSVHAHVLVTSFETAQQRISTRKRKLDDKILTKYAKNFQFPLQGEGFADVHLVHEPTASIETTLQRAKIEQLLDDQVDHDELFAYLSREESFAQMVDYHQGNPYHSRTLSEHTYAVLEYIHTLYEEQDRLVMQWTALLHDIGKPFCKVWKENRGYYSYFGHEHVSAMMSCSFLKSLGYEDDFILDVANKVELHMDIMHGGDAGASTIYHLMGGEHLSKMYFFAEADRYGK